MQKIPENNRHRVRLVDDVSSLWWKGMVELVRFQLEIHGQTVGLTLPGAERLVNDRSVWKSVICNLGS